MNKSHSQYLEEFIKQISYQSFINEFFLDCKDQDKAKILANFISEIILGYLLTKINEKNN
jgi:hypothetical protein